MLNYTTTGIFEHERLKHTIIRTSHPAVQNLAELKQIMNTKLKLDYYSSYFVLSMVKQVK